MPRPTLCRRSRHNGTFAIRSFQSPTAYPAAPHWPTGVGASTTLGYLSKEHGCAIPAGVEYRGRLGELDALDWRLLPRERSELVYRQSTLVTNTDQVVVVNQSCPYNGAPPMGRPDPCLDR